MTDFYALDPKEQIVCMQVLAENSLGFWGIDNAQLDLIKHRENFVFRVQRPDGGRVVLRVHRAGYHSDAALRSELQWVDALARAGIDVPAVVPTVEGALFAIVASDGVPETRQVDMFEWIEGGQMGSIESGLSADPQLTRKLYGDIGAIAARVHNQAVAWQPPPDFDRHAWDVDGLVGDQPFWGRFWELDYLTEQQRERIQAGREQVRRDLIAYGQAPDVYSMIHADFTPENLLVDGDRLRPIDFDDCGFGWHLFELVTPLFFIHGESYFEIARDALITGYRRHRPLSDEHLRQLPLFFLVRGFTYLGWTHTRSETETAREITPMVTDLVLTLVEDYLAAS